MDSHVWAYQSPRLFGPVHKQVYVDDPIIAPSCTEQVLRQQVARAILVWIALGVVLAIPFTELFDVTFVRYVCAPVAWTRAARDAPEQRRASRTASVHGGELKGNVVVTPGKTAAKHHHAVFGEFETSGHDEDARRPAHRPSYDELLYDSDSGSDADSEMEGTGASGGASRGSKRSAASATYIQEAGDDGEELDFLDPSAAARLRGSKPKTAAAAPAAKAGPMTAPSSWRSMQSAMLKPRESVLPPWT